MRQSLLAAALSLAAAVPSFAQAPVPPPPARPNKIDFAAPPQMQSVELMPDKAKTSGNPVQFNFKGWLYGPEGLSFSSPDAAKFPSEERRVIAALSAARKDGIAAVVPYWNPTEQATIKKNVTDPTVNAGMTSFLRSVENSVFLAKILYGPYSILLVQHIGQSLPASQAPARYTMKRVGEDYYLTDELSADPVFVYFAEKYVRQLVAQITGKVPE